MGDVSVNAGRRDELSRLDTQYSVLSTQATQASGLRDEMLDMSDSDSLLEMGTGKSSDASWRWFATLGRLND